MGNIKHPPKYPAQWKNKGSSQTSLNWYLEFYLTNGEVVNLTPADPFYAQGHVWPGNIIVIYQWEMTDYTDSLQ